MKSFKEMTYKEFKKWNETLLCNGWDWGEALKKRVNDRIIKEIDDIKVKLFGFITLKKKTKKAQEEAWERYKRGERI